MLNSDQMQLYHNGVLLGTLSRYGYETPWASAWLIADDPATIPRYAAIYAFLAWIDTIPDDLPGAESDARYAAELAARGLDADQVDGFWGGWAVRTPDGQLHDVVVTYVEDDGYLTWRW